MNVDGVPADVAASAPADTETSLRDDLRAAWEEASEGGDGGNDTAAPADDAVAPPADAGIPSADAPAPGQPRDEGGRFAAKPGDQQQMPGVTAAPAADAQQQPATDQAPGSWRAEAKAVWDTIPPAARAEIARREADASRMASVVDGERRFAREMADVLRPYEQEMRAAGASPQVAVSAFLTNHRILRTGTPEQKVQLARALISDYGLDPSQLFDPNAPTDPHVIALQRQMQQMAAAQRAPQIGDHAPLPAPEGQGIVVSDIDAFRADPAHVHFDKVAPVMATLLDGGHATDLTDAYEKAIRSTGLAAPAPAPAPTPQPQPTAIPQPLANHSQKVAAARLAGASVARSPGPTGEQAPTTLRDELLSNLRKAGFSG